MKVTGKVFKYGDNVDTDVIIPARYLNSFDAQELASHAMVELTYQQYLFLATWWTCLLLLLKVL